MELLIIDNYSNTVIDVPGDSTGVAAHKGLINSDLGHVSFFIQA